MSKIKIDDIELIVTRSIKDEDVISSMDEIFVLSSLFNYELHYEKYRKSIWIWFVNTKRRFCLSLDFEPITDHSSLLKDISLKIDIKSQPVTKNGSPSYKPLQTLKELL